jgi:hypothetical protein
MRAMKKLLKRLLKMMKRSHAPPDASELLAEQRRLDDIALWAKTEQLELSFRAGYWAGRRVRTMRAQPRLSFGSSS